MIPESNRIDLGFVFITSSALIFIRFKSCQSTGGRYSPPSPFSSPTTHLTWPRRPYIPSVVSLLSLSLLLIISIALNTDPYPRQERQRDHLCRVPALRF